MWDYIIVGGGSAGCVIASRLSEDPNSKVLLLNAGLGGVDRMPFVKAPAGALYFDNNLLSWKYGTEPDRSCADRADVFYAGKILGGGSSVNGTMFIRGCADDYDHWAGLGNKGWAYSDLLPCFKRIEKTEIGSDEYHGRNGPLGVDYATPMLDISHRFIEAATEIGIPYNSDVNGQAFEGVSRTPCSVYDGVRQSTARTYLRPAMKRKNLKVVTRALAKRVIFEGQDAVAVEYEVAGTRHIAKANKEIILSAGAVRSPQILMLSGIGNPAELGRLGIPTVNDLPGVGKNYMDHSALHMMYAVKLPTWFRDLSLGKQAYQGLRWLIRNEGPARSGVSQAVAFVRSDDTVDKPDIQISLLPLGPVDQFRTLRKQHKDIIMVFVDECRPVTRGHLSLASSNVKERPLVRFNMLDSEKTLDVILKGVGIVRRIMAAGAIQPYVESELFPGSAATSRASLEQGIREATVSMAHPSGTCKMGQDADAVVDEKLRVRGVRRLRVADASIMPTIPSGNINAPTIMIGEKAAALIREG